MPASRFRTQGVADWPYRMELVGRSVGCGYKEEMEGALQVWLMFLNFADRRNDRHAGRFSAFSLLPAASSPRLHTLPGAWPRSGWMSRRC